MKINKLFFVIIFLLAINTPAFSQEAPSSQNRVTQEEFAVEVVKVLKIEELLPRAALPRDSVLLLEQIGISPLTGWKPKEYLANEDYLVLMAKAQGKENVVFSRANEVEQKNIETINKKWQEAYEKSRQWPSLESLLNNTSYFPHGSPKSPYGTPYVDRNNDHKVDEFTAPVFKLNQLREFLSSQK